MSPEHREGESLDLTTDVFAASVIAFELFVGRRPWPKLSSHKEMLRTVFDPPDLTPDEMARVPADLVTVIMKGLACDPNERWSSAKIMLEALRGTDYFQMLVQGSPEEKRAKVRDWVDSTGVGPDAQQDKLIVDHAPASSSDQDMNMRWNPAGRLEQDPTPQPYRISELPPAQVLPIPPLPPRRESNLNTQELKMSELVVRDQRWWLLGLLVLAVIGMYIGFTLSWNDGPN
jgi:serine/threonine protein kinase